MSSHDGVDEGQRALRAVVITSTVWVAEEFPYGPNWAVASLMGFKHAASSVSALSFSNACLQPSLMPWGMYEFEVGVGAGAEPVAVYTF